ncbi:hypothetical protein F5148DRAFT_1178281 [Russula earlei]|uniref:Uncharacterized protein n=1 Tax=Russula earlei TaxID=71964 RepID=A0ACC0UGE8_9AGAM|nr:hypothetical protein F5148DRAFT_1178281 [Russula earlei]
MATEDDAWVSAIAMPRPRARQRTGVIRCVNDSGARASDRVLLFFVVVVALVCVSRSNLCPFFYFCVFSICFAQPICVSFSFVVALLVVFALVCSSAV